METREVLLKADKVSVVFERIADGKIRVTTNSWDDAVVIWPSQVLEVAVIGKQVGLVLVDKPIAYLDIDETSFLPRMCDAWQANWAPLRDAFHRRSHHSKRVSWSVANRALRNHYLGFGRPSSPRKCDAWRARLRSLRNAFHRRVTFILGGTRGNGAR
jgi:hypothetical protein